MLCINILNSFLQRNIFNLIRIIKSYFYTYIYMYKNNKLKIINYNFYSYILYFNIIFNIIYYIILVGIYHNSYSSILCNVSHFYFIIELIKWR